MDALQQGSQSLKDIHKEYGLNKENVNNIMDDVVETLAEHQEIDDAINQPINLPGVDDSELEEELNELAIQIDEENSKKQKETKIVDNNNNNNDVEDELLAQLQNLKVENTTPTKKVQENPQYA